MLWYPKAVIHEKSMKTKGEYAGGYPKGAVVHFTAGRSEGGLKKAKDTIDGGIKNGFAFLCIGNGFVKRRIGILLGIVQVDFFYILGLCLCHGYATNE